MDETLQLRPADVLRHWGWARDDPRGGFSSGEFALLVDGRLAIRRGGSSSTALGRVWSYGEWEEFAEWRNWQPTTDRERALRAIKAYGYDVSEPGPVAVDQREVRLPPGPIERASYL